MRCIMSRVLVVSSAFLLFCGTDAFAASDEAAIRAGHDLAIGNCIACHEVAPGQTVKPVLGPGIPSFETIANRPGASAESLQESMKSARWHGPSMAATLLPMSRLSDKQRAQVAAYILTLRKS
jgi:mono/diheme cytochrome c family protein